MILVTGGCGYIGSHIVKQLSESGQKVVVIDNLCTGFSNSLLHNEPFYEIDLADREQLDNVFKEHSFTSVIHLAASTVVPESVDKPLKYYHNNTVNTLNLLTAMKEHRVSNIVFSSTAAVYGDIHAVVREDQQTIPQSPYGWSKLMDEKFILDCSAAYGFRYAILRYFNVAGANVDLKIGQKTKDATHLIKVACEVAAGKRDKFLVFGNDYNTPDGTCIRDFIHVDDLASVHLVALDHLGRLPEGKGEIFNCGYGSGYSVLDVLKTIEELSGKKLNVEMAPRRPGDLENVVSDPSKFMNATGWKPQFNSLHKIIQTAYDFEKQL